MTDARRSIRIGAALFLVTLALYLPALRCDFLGFDDTSYVTENQPVRNGLTLRGIAWAFTSTTGGNWHPLTMLSHMLDCQIYGLRAWGHHLTNVLLHAANAVLVFLVLLRMTRRQWPSAGVALLFAVHPAHVESVVWISERKDVLSAFFFLLTLWAYARSRREWALLFYALGLMAKPMLVTLPFILILLDVWPLERARSLGWRVIWEKWPFFVLSAACCAVTIWAQGQAVATAAQLSVGQRFIHSIISYTDYVRVLVYPRGLAAIYPYEHNESAIHAAIAAGMLLAMTMVACTRRYTMVGWFWFLGMLVPVIGLVQVGGQAWADRYSYLPSIGFFIMVVWMGAECAKVLPGIRFLLPAAALALVFVTSFEIPRWRDTRTLFQRATDVTADNYAAMTLIAAADEQEGRLDEAVRLCRYAISVKPIYSDAHFFLGVALEGQGRDAEAMSEFREAIRLQPDFDSARVMAGLLLTKQGNYREAGEEFEAALKSNPQSAAAETDWALALAQEGKWRESAAHFDRGFKLAPGNATNSGAQYQFGVALEHTGDVPGAAAHYAAALRARPDFPSALQHAAWIAATDARPELRDGARAVAMASRACQLTGQKSPSMLLTLAAAYGEAGRFSDALTTVGKAEELAKARGEQGLATQAEKLRAAFMAGRPFHGH